MGIDPTPEQQRVVDLAIQSGAFQDSDEVIAAALSLLAEELATVCAPSRTMTPSKAVDNVRELRKGVTLGGLSIKDLINEGRKR